MPFSLAAGLSAFGDGVLGSPLCDAGGLGLFAQLQGGERSGGLLTRELEHHRL